MRVNKDGEWVGTPIQVERSINDLVLVDNALNDSMLNLRISKAEEIEKGKQRKENKPDDDEESEKGESVNTGDIEDPGLQGVNNTDDGTNEVNDNENTNANEITNGEANARKSSRKRKQRMMIKNDEIGDCDDENDPDYTS